MNKPSTFEGGKTWWLQLSPGEISENAALAIELDIPSKVLLKEMSGVRTLIDRGEYRVYRGCFEGRDVSVVYHGSGQFSMIGAIEELKMLGVKKLVRIGSCGAISEKVHVGDVLLPEAAVRDDRVMLDYVPAEYPAVADRQLLNALYRAAEEEHVPFHGGISMSSATFYPGSGYPTAGGAFDETPYQRAEMWKKLDILGTDIETSSLLVLSRLFGMQGASVLGVSNYVKTGEGGYLTDERVRQMVRIGLRGLTSD